MVQREGEDQSAPAKDDGPTDSASSTVGITEIRATLDLLERQVSQYREMVDQDKASALYGGQFEPPELPSHETPLPSSAPDVAPGEDAPSATDTALDDPEGVVAITPSETEPAIDPEPLATPTVEMPELFAELQSQLEIGLHETASVSVFRDGTEMLRYLSSKDGSGVTPEPQPLFRAFSCGKAMAAAIVWRLLDSGVLEIDAPVATYWPDFAQRGKTDVTLRHVLTHTAGLPLDFGRGDVDWGDWGRMSDILASMPLEYEPGKVVHYHAITFGILVAEVASAATGMNFIELFEREVVSPLELTDTRFVIEYGDDVLQRVRPLRVADGYFDPEMPRKMDWLLANQVLSPGATCITSSSDLAKLYSTVCNGGTSPEGVSWISEEAAADVYAIHASAYNIEGMIKSRVCQGVWRFDDQPNRAGAACGSETFGHGGMGTSIAWGDPDHNISVAILTDKMQAEDVNGIRLNRISAAIRQDLQLPIGKLAELLCASKLRCIIPSTLVH